jgi:hypothetical protein
MVQSNFNFKRHQLTSVVIFLFLVLTISCAPYLIDVPRDPNIYNAKAKFTDVDLYITTFSIKNRSKKDLQIDNTEMMMGKFATYISAQNKFQDIHIANLGFDPPKDKNYLTVDVQITPEYTKKRTWFLDALAIYPFPGYWPITPQWGVVTVKFTAHILDKNGNPVMDYNVEKKKDYKVKYYSWYNTSIVESTFRDCYEQAFAEFSQVVKSKEDIILAAAGSEQSETTTPKYTYSTTNEIDIEQNIPETKIPNPDAIAVVIGNSNYKNTRSVKFAVRDAQIMQKYLINTLGFKEGNIFLVFDATKADFELYFGIKDNFQGKLYNTVKSGKSDVFIYYSGHGAPDIKSKKGFFVPVDCDPQYVQINGYPIDVFYENLSHIAARSMTVILDACFSGAELFENISPLIPVVENTVTTNDNAIVLSSSSGSQVSSWYPEKKHGLFTYFFLKAIHDQKADLNHDGNLTYEEIYRYISDETEGVPYYARSLNGVEQKPTIEGKMKDRVLVKYTSK